MSFNRGDSYEDIVFNICQRKGIVADDTTRGGASTGADIKFIHNGSINNLEVKLDLNADYGQKGLVWENNIWRWRKEDSITRMYDTIGILDHLNAKGIIPPSPSIRHSLSDQIKTAVVEKCIGSSASEVNENPQP